MLDNRPILVIGGTRGTGLLIARLLVRQGLSVRALARDRERAAAVLGPAVEVLAGDITQADTLPRAMEAATHIVFTAGCRSGRPATAAKVRATEYHGVLNTLAAARGAGFAGRFLYMTSSGVARRSLASVCLNLYKGNTLVWRRRAEQAIRESGLSYTIVRAGMLQNRPVGQRVIEVTQDALPLSIRHRIARADVAEVFVAALDHPRAARATFEVFWGRGRRRQACSALLQRLKPDAELAVPGA